METTKIRNDFDVLYLHKMKRPVMWVCLFFPPPLNDLTLVGSVHFSLDELFKKAFRSSEICSTWATRLL